MISGVRFAPVVLLLAACGGSISAQKNAPQEEGPSPTRVLVRADVKHDAAAPALRASDVTVNVGGREVPVVNVTPAIASAGLSAGARSQPLEVAVLLDEGLRTNFDTNLREVVDFARSTANGNTAVSVGYMRNGTVAFGQPFSTDPDVVAKGVRIPLSAPGISASPYFCLQDLLKHWPTRTGAPRVVIMITNGIDYYNGSVSPLNQDSPYVDETIRLAQKSNVPVYSIYFGGRAVNGFYSSSSGQNYLSELAQKTGGDTYNQGQITPPSIAPFFRQFQQALSRTYDVTFQDSGRDLQRLKISTNLPGVKLHAQEEVQAGTVRE
ncbi:vWA domain-containing protein [Terriglobus aquaticus]|uniref:VWA domain-containing protein n=1 Tax=Terriglobus aquaticus TaxID=940139 RepID=A0ABW9KK80_9BACT|nr:hypothetical protein [Terriglobus aquaticus]